MENKKINPSTELRINAERSRSIKKEEFFDDCPICRAMKAAQEQGRELTLEELKETFKKAKEQGGIVGGEWFKD